MQQLLFWPWGNLKFNDFNFTTKSPKIVEDISKFILIIADCNRNKLLIIGRKQLPSEFLFNSVAFFPGRPV